MKCIYLIKTMSQHAGQFEQVLLPSESTITPVSVCFHNHDSLNSSGVKQDPFKEIYSIAQLQSDRPYTTEMV